MTIGLAQGKESPRIRRVLLIPGLIFLLSFAIRLFFVLVTPLDLQIGETRNVALALLDHRGFADAYRVATGPTAHCNPFLPVFIAAIYYLFGAGYAGELVRCLVFTAVLSLCYALLPIFAAKLNIPIGVGAVAGVICAAFPFMRTSETTTFGEEPVIALSLLFLVLYTCNLLKKQSIDWRDTLMYGFVWGASFYISSSLLSVFLSLILLLLVARRDSARIRLAVLLVLALAAALLAVTPWTVRNYETLHALMFMRSNFGFELAVGYNDGASPSLKENLLSGYQASHHPFLSEKEALSIRELGEGEYNRRKAQQAFRWIREHPLTSAKLTVQRIVYFWSGQRADYLTAIPNALLSLFAFWGCVLLWRREPTIGRVLAVVFVSFPLPYYLIQTGPRYSLPIHPLVAFAAAYAIWHIRDYLLRLKQLVPVSGVLPIS
jgi:hypothetical protein